MKREKIKGIIFLVVAAIFFVYIFFSGGDIKSFFAAVFVIVCGFIGIMYIRGDKKQSKKKKRPKQK